MEIEELKAKLLQREKDCALAASLGQSLLGQISHLQEHIEVLEKTLASSPNLRKETKRKELEQRIFELEDLVENLKRENLRQSQEADRHKDETWRLEEDLNASFEQISLLHKKLQVSEEALKKLKSQGTFLSKADYNALLERERELLTALEERDMMLIQERNKHRVVFEPEIKIQQVEKVVEKVIPKAPSRSRGTNTWHNEQMDEFKVRIEQMKQEKLILQDRITLLEDQITKEAERPLVETFTQTEEEEEGDTFSIGSGMEFDEGLFAQGFETDAPDHSIESLTLTMIGAWFQKFDRYKRHSKLRYFWVNPYSKTLNWSNKPPSQSKYHTKKSVPIESVKWTDPPALATKNYPPTSNNCIVIQTKGREVHIQPLTWDDHNHWTKGLSLLISRQENPHEIMLQSPSEETLNQSSRIVQSPFSHRRVTISGTGTSELPTTLSHERLYGKTPQRKRIHTVTSKASPTKLYHPNDSSSSLFLPNLSLVE